MILYTADFETGRKIDVQRAGYNRVVIWSLCPVMHDADLDDVIVGYNICDFFNELFKIKDDVKVYFHNLSYDGEFIVEYLLRHGWTHNDTRKLAKGEFTTLITNLKVWYNIILKHDHTITIADSYKLLAKSEDDLLKDCEIPVLKIPVDWKKQPLLYDNDWIIPDDLMHQRVKNDSLGMSLLLSKFKTPDNDIYMKADTAAACAFMSLKERSFNIYSPTTGHTGQAEGYYKAHYPELVDPYKKWDNFDKARIEFDEMLRLGYYGGFCYVNPIHATKDLTNIVAYDQNSKYPYHMSCEKYPYGRAMSEYEAYALARDDDDFNNNFVYIVEMQYVEAVLRNNWIPWLQRRGFDYHGTAMLAKVSEDRMVLAQPLYELFNKSYKLLSSPIIKKYYFAAERDRFNDHVTYWYDIKTRYKKTNPSLTMYAKIQLNSSYGKFAQRLERSRKRPEFDPVTNQVVYKTIEAEETTQRYYMPVAMFISGYGRADIIQKAQSFGNNFVYCDTDSLHLTGGPYSNKSLKEHGIRVSNELGDWKLDKHYTNARYLHAKCYAGYFDNGDLDIHIAGYNCHDPDIYDKITLNDIYVGARLPGKLARVKCPGGCYLDEIDYIIKDISQEDVYL